MEAEGNEVRNAIVLNQMRRGASVKGHHKNPVADDGALRLRREEVAASAEDKNDGENDAEEDADAFFGRLTTADGT